MRYKMVQPSLAVASVHFVFCLVYLASEGGAAVGDFCTDVSYWDVLKYQTTIKQCCKTKIKQRCTFKSDHVCKKVPEIQCEVVSWPLCESTPTLTESKKCEVRYQDYSYIHCKDVKSSITHTKKVPECREITRENCVTDWKVDAKGNKVWGGKETCTPVSWEECGIVERQVELPMMRTYCSAASIIKWADIVDRTKHVTGLKTQCQVKSSVDCKKKTVTKCASVSWEECSMVPAEECQPVEVYTPSQEKVHRKNCFNPNAAAVTAAKKTAPPHNIQFGTPSRADLQTAIDGRWTEFSDWSSCSKSCGVGNKERSRTCANPPPSFGGEDCQGHSREVQTCVEVENCRSSNHTEQRGKRSKRKTSNNDMPEMLVLPIDIHLSSSWNKIFRKHRGGGKGKAKEILDDVKKLFLIPSLETKFDIRYEDSNINSISIHRNLKDSDDDVSKEALKEFEDEARPKRTDTAHVSVYLTATKYIEKVNEKGRFNGNYICDEKKSVVMARWYNEDKQFIQTVAHEIGHALGFFHDFIGEKKNGKKKPKTEFGRTEKCGENGNFNNRRNYLMNYSRKRRLDKWSKCTREDFRRYYGSVTSQGSSFCLKVHKSAGSRVPETNFQPGSAICRTTPVNGKNGNTNTPCIFPFTHKGVTYTKCPFHKKLKKFWCSTKVDISGNHVSGRREWGFCGPNCPRIKQSGHTSAGSRVPETNFRPGTILIESFLKAAEWQGDVLGYYDLTTEKINNRPVYSQRGGYNTMYHNEEYAAWTVASTPGKSSAWLYVKSYKDIPPSVGWKYINQLTQAIIGRGNWGTDRTFKLILNPPYPNNECNTIRVSTRRGRRSVKGLYRWVVGEWLNGKKVYRGERGHYLQVPKDFTEWRIGTKKTSRRAWIKSGRATTCPCAPEAGPTFRGGRERDWWAYWNNGWHVDKDIKVTCV